VRNFVTSLVFGLFVFLGAGAAQAQSVPDCDHCDLCTNNLSVKLKSDFMYQVVGATLVQCLTIGCATQDVTRELNLPMTGGQSRDVNLWQTPSVTYNYLRFKYCTNTTCSQQAEVTRTITHCVY
jgi:hypothetical protein